MAEIKIHNHDHGHGDAGSLDDIIRNRAIGCLVGQAIGDALGTRYEFLDAKSAIDEMTQDLDQWGHLPILGGGPFQVVRGQVTDDTELALGLARSLVRRQRFDLEDIAQTYAVWMNSPPFDCGLTTQKAFGATNPLKLSPAENYRAIKQASAQQNQGSQSNGCLMRISPLAIASVRWSNPQSVQWASYLECELTNPNPITQDATHVFVEAVRMAILTGDPIQVYEMAISVATTPDVQHILTRANDGPEPITLSTGQSTTTDSKQFMGYFGVALQNAMYELIHGDSFEESMIDILSRGGDTDTNGCIAGALLGAVYGYHQIPSDWYQAVINAQTARRQAQYPYVKTSDLAQLALELLGEPDHHILEPTFYRDHEHEHERDAKPDASQVGK